MENTNLKCSFTLEVGLEPVQTKGKGLEAVQTKKGKGCNKICNKKRINGSGLKILK